MTPADQLIPRLDKVIERGGNRWVARCPAHEDNAHSLDVEEKDDGTLLVHCFAGCSAGEIMSAVDLTLAELFPQRFDAPSRKAKHNPRDLLILLSLDATFLLLCAEHMAQGKPLDDADKLRLEAAVRKINAVRDAL